MISMYFSFLSFGVMELVATLFISGELLYMIIFNRYYVTFGFLRVFLIFFIVYIISRMYLHLNTARWDRVSSEYRKELKYFNKRLKNNEGLAIYEYQRRAEMQEWVKEYEKTRRSFIGLPNLTYLYIAYTLFFLLAYYLQFNCCIYLLVIFIASDTLVPIIKNLFKNLQK